MAELFLFNIAERVLEKIASLVVGEVLSLASVKSDLRKLQETMITFKAVLLDAERQQHQDEKLRLCMWKLRDIFYDADDVLDEIECEAVRKEYVNHLSTSSRIKVLFMASSCFSPLIFPVKMGQKIREINERFDKITAEWSLFNLGQEVHSQVVIHRETHSFLNSSDVIGRDLDKEKIVNLLLQPNDSGNIPVIPIVGIGGLGKTMLTQFVYNDERVTKFFPLKIWVCAGDNFDLTRLVKEIISSITREECVHSKLDALLTHLGSLLLNKKFLLVLDDVWNENRVKWVELRDLLMSFSNLPENKIIVTTRSFKVASVMSSMLPYELKGLPHEDCLALFKRWAFNDGEENRYPNLMRIGEEIVKKCKGIPLAVRTLGSLLFLKTIESEWKSIRDCDISRLEQSENDILPILKLSYNNLPPHLQRCLACLSLYEKGHTYHSDDVILILMANGLLEHPKENEEWEDVGNRYLKELWSRCFIQDIEDKGFFFKFKVHDLIHDLALDVSQKECKSLYSQTESIDEKVRHVSFCDDQPLGKGPQALKKRKHVRTVFLQQSSTIIDLSFLHFCVSNFKYLRVLYLRNISSLKALPDSIGTLKHLRILDLRGCHQIRKIPSSFYKLQSLVMLKMKGVPLMQLPDRMQSFMRLRCLEISIGAMHLKELRAGCWSSLQYLGLIYCENFERLFEGMQYLTSLRTIHLFDCPKLVSLPRSLKFLTKLEHLLVHKCGAINLDMELKEEEDQHLQLSLKTFSLEDSDVLKDLPRLLLEGSSCTLQWISLARCYNLEVLPEWLPNLAALEKLEIIECPKLSSLPEGMNRLTALRQLKVMGCPRLSERCRRDGGADWPKVAHVQDFTLI